jgi:hypothetical protein
VTAQQSKQEARKTVGAMLHAARAHAARELFFETGALVFMTAFSVWAVWSLGWAGLIFLAWAIAYGALLAKHAALLTRHGMEQLAQNYIAKQLQAAFTELLHKEPKP